MLEMVRLIEQIIVTAEQLLNKVRFLRQDPAVDSNPEAVSLEVLCEEVLIAGIGITNILTGSIDNINLLELKDQLTIAYEAMSSLDEMKNMVVRTLPGPVVANPAVNQMKNDVTLLKQLFTELVAYITEIYGRRESLFIFTPEFLHLAEIGP